jgi:L,D-transpeptidase catalytic domain
MGRLGSRHRSWSCRRRLAAVSAAVGLVCLGAPLVAAPAYAEDGTASAAQTPEEEPAAAAEARRTPLVAGTPCTITAKACVDLESRHAWLLKNGKVFRGPVAIASGGRGQQTPIGHSLRVYRKDKDHKTAEFKLRNGRPAPMPYAVFFADGGIAFHGGDPNKASAGCIHLALSDAKAFYNYLQIGDQVQVVKASVELAARKADAVARTADSNGRSDADHDHGDDRRAKQVDDRRRDGDGADEGDDHRDD